MNTAGQEGTHREDHGRGPKTQIHPGAHTTDTALLDNQVFHFLLEQTQVLLVFDYPTNRLSIQTTIGLCACCAYRGAFAAIKHAKLDAGLIGSQGHRATHGIDLTY